jgi:hypothetical protein
MISVLGRTGFALALALMALSSALTSPAQAGVNLIANGDFSSTLLSSRGGYICGAAGNPSGSACASNVTSWSAGCANDDCGNSGSPSSLMFPGGGASWNGGNGLYAPLTSLANYSGNYIGLDGDPIYAVNFYQTVNGLTPGHTYMLSFYQSAAQQARARNSTSDSLKVSLGAQTHDSPTMDSTGAQTPWERVEMWFTASRSSEVLDFFTLGTGTPPIALLADVSLIAVPEPATWAMLVVGVAAVGLAGRVARRKRAAPPEAPTRIATSAPRIPGRRNSRRVQG